MDKPISVLEEIFQRNQADLDFGIYRILNLKREEINTVGYFSFPAAIADFRRTAIHNLDE